MVKLLGRLNFCQQGRKKRMKNKEKDEEEEMGSCVCRLSKKEGEEEYNIRVLSQITKLPF